MSALNCRPCRARAYHLSNYLSLALVWHEKVDSAIITAVRTLDLHAGHSGIEDIIGLSYVLLRALIIRKVPTWSSLL
jgi:hypothetical protein